MHIRQVATLLGYGEPQILEVFKDTLSTKYIGYYFCRRNGKENLTKEEIDSQLTRQS